MRILILGLLFIIVFFTLNMLYKNTNYFRNQFKQVEKFKEVPNNLEIVNTGSSYARFAFDYSNTQLEGFNFGLQPQSLSYDFKILKQYTSKLKKDCIVLIILPNLVFGFLNYDNDNTNNKYYYFLNIKSINNYKKIKYLTRIVFPILTARSAIRHIIKDTTENNLYNQTKNMMTKEQVQRDALSRVNGWIKQFNLKDTTSCDFSSELCSMFEKTTMLVNEIINYCINNEFKPVLITPPTSKIINDMMSKEFMQGCLYNNISKANTQKIPFYDYLNDERFQDYKLYINSDMLNKTGRELFTKAVIEDLKNIGYIQE